MFRKRVSYFFILAAAVLSLSTAACFRFETPPGPDLAGGVYENTGYESFHWQEGLHILIWHDALTTSTCDSQGATNNDTHLVQCRAQAENGTEIFWEIETKDGRTAILTINNQPFDLSAGNVFLISTAEGSADIQQLERDLSGITPQDHESITQYGLADPDIAAFVQATVPDE